MIFFKSKKICIQETLITTFNASFQTINHLSEFPIRNKKQKQRTKGILYLYVKWFQTQVLKISDVKLFIRLRFRKKITTSNIK